MMVYPPFCDITVLSVSSTVREVALDTVNKIFENIKELLDNEFKDVKLHILGPSAAAVPKINLRYRFRMIIKCRFNVRFREMIKKAMSVKRKGDVSVNIDVNPESVI